MKIAVIGAGAIGGLVAAYLKNQGADVLLIARSESAAIINQHGLRFSGVRGEGIVKLACHERLSEAVDMVIVATKTQDLERALHDNSAYIKNAILLTTQNGVRADAMAREFFPADNIVSSIVMFGATMLAAGEITHNFEGSLIVGSAFGSAKGRNDVCVERVREVLSPVFPVVATDDIRGMKYLKIFVNANNCIAAILGVSMQEAFADTAVSRISIAVWREGLRVVKHAGITLVSLPDFPLDRLVKLATIPIDEAAKIYSGIMSGLSSIPLYGSILQSIKRGKASEVDYINGEFVQMARECGMCASLNETLVNMVHRVEKTRTFYSKEELIEATKGMVN